jgi:hypothetical protein
MQLATLSPLFIPVLIFTIPTCVLSSFMLAILVSMGLGKIVKRTVQKNERYFVKWTEGNTLYLSDETGDIFALDRQLISQTINKALTGLDYVEFSHMGFNDFWLFDFLETDYIIILYTKGEA